MSMDSGPAWPANRPLAQALLVSLALHLALLALVAPRTFLDTPEDLVIQARLEQAPEVPKVASVPMPTRTSPPPPERLPPPPEAKPVPEPERPPAAQPTPPQLPVLMPPSEPRIAARSDLPAEAPPLSKSPTEIVAPSSSSIVRTPVSEVAPASPSPVSQPPSPVLALPSPVDTNWYQARQVDRVPRAIGTIQPQYPTDARRRGVEGHLKLMVKIDDLGRVLEAEVLEATPPGVFDEAALAAFKNARFLPALRQGTPVRFQAYMRIEFKLE